MVGYNMERQSLQGLLLSDPDQSRVQAILTCLPCAPGALLPCGAGAGASRLPEEQKWLQGSRSLQGPFFLRKEDKPAQDELFVPKFSLCAYIQCIATG